MFQIFTSIINKNLARDKGPHFLITWKLQNFNYFAGLLCCLIGKECSNNIMKQD